MYMQAKSVSVFQTESKSKPGTTNKVLRFDGTIKDGDEVVHVHATASLNGGAMALYRKTLEAYGIDREQLSTGVIGDPIEVAIDKEQTPDGETRFVIVPKGNDEAIVAELFA